MENRFGAYTGSLDPKSTLVNRIDELFPSIPRPFAGYAVVSGDGDVLASALLYSYASLTAVNGHPVNPQASGGTTLYGAQLGAPDQFTRVILVNAGITDANLTLTAYKPDGSSGGKLVRMTLAAGQQFVSDLAQVFGFDAGSPQAGSFTVTSDQPSVFGDLSFGDSSPGRLSRASLPLSTGPVTAAILPYLQNDSTASTTVNIANSSSVVAAVTLTVFNSGGNQIGKSTVNVPGNGFSSIGLTAAVAAAANLPAGYITLSSSQPVVAFGEVGPVSGADFAAFTAQPILAAPGGGGPQGPMIDVSTSRLDFGTVNTSQTPSPTMTLTIRNTGGGTLSLSALSLANGPFSLVSPPVLPFNVPAAGLQLTVRFAPVTTGPQNATLTIASNDPDPTRSKFTVTLVGNAASGGTAQTLEIRAGNPPAVITSWDFGTVAAMPPASVLFQVNNKTSFTVTVTASFVNSKFSLGAPGSLSFPIGGGSFENAQIFFRPTDTTPQTGSVTFTANGQSVTIALRGSGNGGAGGTACVAAPANLVSRYAGDGNANDLSGGNNGTVQGGASFATGQVGQAFNFDGNAGYVSAGSPANLRLTQAITIEAWINPRSGPSGANLSAIVTKWGQNASDTPDSDSYGLWLGQSNGVINLFSAIHQAGPKEPHVQGGAIPLNAWTHVAMTFDGATGQYVAYINGQPVDSATAPGSMIATSRNVFIGREDSFLPRPFNGLIDEVGIFNRALTAAEIQGIFNAGSAGKCKTGGPSGGSGQTVQIVVDDTTFETIAGFPQGAARAYFVNRLTPPSYPATLRSVQIAFLNASDGLKKGDALNILSGANLGGSVTINGIQLASTPSTVAGTDQFNSFNVAPITIQSGDFVVGFSAVNPPNFFLAAIDTSSGSKQRSYLSSDGTNFSPLDSIPQLAGNFGIRATVDLGGTGTGGKQSGGPY